MEVYTRHCTPCHGERGRGDGPAARFLDPPPRDFDRGAFRLVSTTNGVPTDNDLFEVIAGGLPGTAMVPYAHLGGATVRDLVGVIRGFTRKGLRDRLADDAYDEEELETWIRDDTTPGPILAVSDEPLDTVDSQSRGRLHYQTNCAACHGADARGAPMIGKVTSEGYAVQPRDLTRGILRGGRSPEHIFQRIRLGMPGTPMPALTIDALDDRGVWDMVHYLRTVMPRNATTLHDAVRLRIPVKRVDRPLPVSASDPRFQEATEVHMALAPLRAHEATTPGISVRAVHDGDMIVFLAVYMDPTWNGTGAPDEGPPDGLAARITHLAEAPVMPMPGLALPLDRALWLAGPMPVPEDPVFDGATPRFANPDRVCRAPVRPQQAGSGTWKNNVWTVILPIRPIKAQRITKGGTMPASFALFDGALRRGPLPVAFSHWHLLVFE